MDALPLIGIGVIVMLGVISRVASKICDTLERIAKALEKIVSEVEKDVSKEDEKKTDGK